MLHLETARTTAIAFCEEECCDCCSNLELPLYDIIGVNSGDEGRFLLGTYYFGNTQYLAFVIRVKIHRNGGFRLN